MQDQVDQIKLRGEKRVTAINSFLTFKERKQLIANLEAYRFIFLSPEMLNSNEVLQKLKEIGIGLLVIDEAHCISQWGPDFRPDYLRLGHLKKTLGSPCTLALTATATEEIRKDIAKKLNLNNWKEWVYSVNRPNIALEVNTFNDVAQKENKLLLLVQRNTAPGIIFFSSRKKAEEMQAAASARHVSCSVYHGGMETDQRILIQQQFINGQLDWIFATNAFGMGINKNNIRTVIHFHMSSSVENFLQEIGRAGRDLKQAHSILLYSANDEFIPLQLAELEKPALEQIENFYSMFKRDMPINEIQEKLMLTDTQVRVLRYYIQHEPAEHWAERINHLLEKRVNSKKEKVMEMKSYIETDSCRRAKLLAFFEESPSAEADHCCDNCGIGNMVMNREKSSYKEVNWKEKLDRLLIKNE
ncbi:hypothetical protein KP77_21730 [Jeotgalibacillus alimentarius]|uniref:ATP-dependent DNA helicase RecQ n=2 Tax=Jeotgalibacillus alimentarius TaxID=135826 RepID=A0A0C2VJ98_9BACL|nr:hypothetical protein KP77_21730 [Jeotgalibacillus alimentarius]